MLKVSFKQENHGRHVWHQPVKICWTSIIIKNFGECMLRQAWTCPKLRSKRQICRCAELDARKTKRNPEGESCRGQACYSPPFPSLERVKPWWRSTLQACVWTVKSVGSVLPLLNFRFHGAACDSCTFVHVGLTLMWRSCVRDWTNYVARTHSKGSTVH